MGRIVAIGGGELDTTHNINKYIVELSGKKNPNFLFVGTASHDAEGYITAMRDEFEGLGCAVRALSLTTETYTDEEIDNMLDQADIIYVGGGDTAFMMDIWEKHGLDRKLQQIYQEDLAVLSGLSAGAICWFNCGHSDSKVFWNNDIVGYGWVNELLDIHSFAFCPHYNERVDSFDNMMMEKSLPGIALEDNVAFVDQNGSINFVASDDTHKSYIIKYVDGALEKQEQKVDVLYI